MTLQKMGRGGTPVVERGTLVLQRVKAGDTTIRQRPGQPNRRGRRECLTCGTLITRGKCVCTGDAKCG